LPVGGDDELKRTNEIGMAIPLLDGCDLAGKDVTADALLTQRTLASYLVGRQAHYHFTVKANQPTLQRDIALWFAQREAPDFVEAAALEHGRIETRRIWCSSALNAYLDFPHVGQVYLIEREAIDKKTGKPSADIALGVTSSHTATGLAAASSGHQPRALGHRKRPSHHRLELRRGSQPHPHRCAVRRIWLRQAAAIVRAIPTTAC